MGLKLNGFWSAGALVVLTAGPAAQTPAAPAQTPTQTPAPAPAQDKPTFKVQVDLVTNDIIVRDEKGNFIPDLKQDEFEIYEDGVKQDIIVDDRRHRRACDERAGRAAAAAARRHHPAADPADQRRVGPHFPVLR